VGTVQKLRIESLHTVETVVGSIVVRGKPNLVGAHETETMYILSTYGEQDGIKPQMRLYNTAGNANNIGIECNLPLEDMIFDRRNILYDVIRYDPTTTRWSGSIAVDTIVAIHQTGDDKFEISLDNPKYYTHKYCAPYKTGPRR